MQSRSSDGRLSPEGRRCAHRPPTSYTLHSAFYTLHPTPYTLHPTPYTLHPTPYTLRPSVDPGVRGSRDLNCTGKVPNKEVEKCPHSGLQGFHAYDFSIYVYNLKIQSSLVRFQLKKKVVNQLKLNETTMHQIVYRIRNRQIVYGNEKLI